MLTGIYIFGSLGINLCYHRMLTHRGLLCPRWVEHGLAILGVCCMQDTPARWVAVHRRHHQFSDERDDPHSPHVNLFWGHMGWMLLKNHDLGRMEIYSRYAKDILRDPFYKRLETSALYPAIIVGSWFAFFAAGFGSVYLAGIIITTQIRVPHPMAIAGGNWILSFWSFAPWKKSALQPMSCGLVAGLQSLRTKWNSSQRDPGALILRTTWGCTSSHVDDLQIERG